MTLTIDALVASPASAAKPLRMPAALVPGDLIGVVAPSSSPRESWVARGIKALERAGFQVRLDTDFLAFRRFLRKEDGHRAESFMQMWMDPRVKAIIGGTGGYGAVRMLQHLDPDVFRNNPKSFVGYSDITALHLWLNRCAGLRTFHGPTVDDLVPGRRDPTLASLLAALTLPDPGIRMGMGVSRAVRPGRAVGRLVGGNLSLVQQSIGTPYEVQVDGAVLFLEETKDPMSVVDERLLHLRASGLLGRVSGLVFGHLSLDRSEEDEFEDFVLDLVSDLDVPVLMDLPAGHEIPNLTLPLGTEVELVVEGETGWVRYNEDALTTPLSD
jgi:muramoyltetrapeptide carboxypeptidase